MYKTIRKKIASSISEIERVEEFAWGKWLKEPLHKGHTVEAIETSVLDTKPLNSWLQKPDHQKKKFLFQETFVFPEHKNVRPKKAKTHTVFFELTKPGLKKLKLFDKEFKVENKPQKIDIGEISSKLKNPKSKDKTEIQAWKLKADILKIDLLNFDNLAVDKLVGKDFKIEFKAATGTPKIYKVKIVSLDKIKLAKIYYLKNISLHDVRLLSDSYDLLAEPVIYEEEIKYFINEWEKTAGELQKNIPAKKAEETLEINEHFTNESITQKISEPLPLEIEVDKIPEEKIEEEINFPALEKVKENIEAKDEVEQEEEIVQGNEFESLYHFQKKGSEFLIKNKRVLLADEMGLGKTIQVVAALKNCIGNKKIKSAIIVCKSSEIGSHGKIAGEVDGWLGHFYQKFNELNVKGVSGTPQERSKLWKEIPDVLVISYDSFFFDLGENNVDIKDLKKIDCFVFDEVQNLFDHKNYNIQKLTETINPKYLWALTSSSKESVKKKLEDIFNNNLSIKGIIGKKRREIENDLPEITWQNKWLNLDEEQFAEYNEAFATAKEKVQWFLESGNPLRFNANVFTLLHQIKQVCNFSEKKNTSPKTKLLLEQVTKIADNNQKVIVFSQYDKAGTKKIEELFKKSGIKFLSYAPGMSTKDMETILKNFSHDNSVTALVTGVKSSKIRIQTGEIPYVIHFDVWWNPATLWQTAETIGGLSKEKLNVYSYMMKGTVEERIHSLLYDKGFLNKQVMETINSDSIAEMISNPEWLEIFDMPDEEYKQKYQMGILETEKRIDSYSFENFVEKGKNFFTKLGYKNLDVIEHNEEDMFDINGSLKKGKFDLQLNARFLLKDVVTEDEIEAHLTGLKEKANDGKFFLITRGTFEGEYHCCEELIDRQLLVNYFYQFVIK